MEGKKRKIGSSIIFSHGDSDGICSASIAKNAFYHSDVYFTSPVNLLDKLNSMSEGYDNIIICDIAVDERTHEALFEKINKLCEVSNVYYIDHHPIPYSTWGGEWFYHDENVCTSEIAYQTFEAMLGRDIRRVSIYGAIGDYADNTSRIKEWCRDWDKRALYFQAGTLVQATIFVGRDHNIKRKIVDNLSKDILPSEIPKLLNYAKKASLLEEELRLYVKKNVISMSLVSYVINAKGYMSKSAIYAASYGKTPIGISAEYRDKKDVYDLSLRSRNGIDINIITRKASKFAGGTGGGHPMAAGARIPSNMLEKFLTQLNKLAERYDSFNGVN